MSDNSIFVIAIVTFAVSFTVLCFTMGFYVADYNCHKTTYNAVSTKHKNKELDYCTLASAK